MTFIKWWWENKLLTWFRSEECKFSVILYSSFLFIGIAMAVLENIGFPIWEILIGFVVIFVLFALSFAIRETIRSVISEYKDRDNSDYKNRGNNE